ncbi:Uncharacterised protein [Raoultella terrigena]|uniref:Uncharacterized protein n=1 Tax=Raoultella terrigena TaxID=577 RepID=A0A4U9D316_RAOTE|nr:Uncharacterised protein [Raoultella terrigena]
MAVAANKRSVMTLFLVLLTSIATKSASCWQKKVLVLR